MIAKINKSLVNSLKPSDKDIKVRDTDLSGFELKMTPAGKIVYRVDYRINGKRRCVTIGKPGITPEQARAMAARTMQAVAAGEDPAETSMEAKRALTVAELAERYIAEHASVKKKPRSMAEDMRMIKKLINPEIGNRKAGDITRADILALHHKYRKTPTQANRILSLLSKIMNLAEAWGIRPMNTNPCTHVERFKEKSRKRFLDSEELSRLGKVLKEIEDSGEEPKQALSAIRLLIFTGARMGEIVTAKWGYVKRDREVLELPDSKTDFKQILLSEPAMEIVNELIVLEGNEYLIPGQKSGTHLARLRDVWRRIREKAGLSDVRLHDLRHTFASTGVSSGINLPIIGGLLGHKSPAMTQRYAHLQVDPLHDAAKIIGKKITKAMGMESTRQKSGSGRAERVDVASK